MDQVLNDAKVHELIFLYEFENWTLTGLAEKYNVAVSTVSRIITGLTWRHITSGENISRNGKDTEYRRAYIEARRDQGCTSHSVIAKELGISRQAVSKLATTKKGSK